MLTGLKHTLAIWSIIVPVDIYPKDLKSYDHIKIFLYVHMFIAALFKIVKFKINQDFVQYISR